MPWSKPATVAQVESTQGHSPASPVTGHHVFRPKPSDSLQVCSQQRPAPVPPVHLPCATREILKDSAPCLKAGATEQGKRPLQSSWGQRSCRSNTSAKIPNPYVTVASVGQYHEPDREYIQPSSRWGNKEWAYAGTSIPRFSAEAIEKSTQRDSLSDMSIIVQC